MAEQIFSDDELEHRIAEKLQTLIIKVITLRFMSQAREAAVFPAHDRGVAAPLRRLLTRDLCRLTAQLHSCAGAPSRKLTAPFPFHCSTEKSVASLTMTFRRANLVSRLREIVTHPR